MAGRRALTVGKAVPRGRAVSFGFALACACFVLLAAGCAEPDDRAGSQASTITVLYCCDEWLMAPHWNLPTQQLVFLPLVFFDESGEVEGRLARSWERSPDFRSWTIHLRGDVRWHDGVPVTAHDIKFTMDLRSHPDVLLDPPGAYSVSVLDDSTYTITHHGQASDITSSWDYPDFWRVYYPKHLLENLDPQEIRSWGFWTQPVGNGPYRYVRHVPGTMMELEANAHDYRGKPKIERVVLKFSQEPTLTELLSGNVDVLTYVDPLDLLKLESDPRFRVYSRVLPNSIQMIAWNQRHPAFRDPKVRRALTLAIDRRELRTVLNFPGDVPIFDVIFTPRQFRRRDFPDPLPYDPEEAHRLLDEAGWRDSDGDGVREREGEELRFTAVVLPLFGLERASVYVQEQLRRTGVQMELQRLDVSAALQRIRAGEFEAAIGRIITGLTHADGHLRFFGGTSPIGFVNPEVIDLLNQAEKTLDPDAMDAIYRGLMAIFQEELPVTFLYPWVYTTVAHRRVRGLSSPHRTEPVMNMAYLWLEAER